MAGRPLKKPIGLPRVHDRGRRCPDLHRLLAAEPEPFELAGRVGIGVDAHPTAQIDGQLQKFLRRITSLRAAKLISIAVPVAAQAPNTISASKLDGSRTLPASSLPVQWPRMSL